MAPALPDRGAVLGVDVGFSPTRRSSAVCRLDWTRETIAWEIARFRAIEPERTQTLRRLADRPLRAAAFDGPLTRGLEVLGRYRAAERMLTRKIGRHIGQPGSSGAPVGKLLAAATGTGATLVRATSQVAAARHREAIDAAAIVEAFPGAALGLLIDEPGKLEVRRGNRSDVFYAHLAEARRLDGWLSHLLPARRVTSPFGAVRDHDERAALVCALTALGLAAGAYTAVGDDADGWIILPPRVLLADWAWPLLAANAAEGAGRLRDASTATGGSSAGEC